MLMLDTLEIEVKIQRNYFFVVAQSEEQPNFDKLSNFCTTFSTRESSVTETFVSIFIRIKMNKIYRIMA